MTKSLKPVLALSVAALTLLAGCAKGDANTAWSAVKKEIKAELQVKTWDTCEFVHTDVNKFLKTDAGKEVSEENAAEMKKEGNGVALFYTFTLKDGTTYFGTGSYSTKSKELTHSESKYGTGLEGAVYSAAKTVWDEAVKNIDAAYQTAGVLVK